MKFYRCKHCGNIVTYVENHGVPIVCCSEEMLELIPQTTEASAEKHIPIVNINSNKVDVTVGATPHPMTKEHYIVWIAIETKNGIQIKNLNLNCSPQTSFSICDDDYLISTYAYCNIHGLWKKDL